jgi:hypothetical protein
MNMMVDAFLAILWAFQRVRLFESFRQGSAIGWNLAINHSLRMRKVLG